MVPIAQTLTHILVLRSLQVAGADAVSMSDREGDGLGRSVVALRADAGNPSCTGTITFDPMLLPANSRVWLRGTPAANRLRMSLLAPGAVMHATVDGCVEQTAGRGGAVRVSGTRAITVRLGHEEADVDIAVTDATPLAFAPSVSSTALSVAHVERLSQDGATHVRQVSTLTSGRLFLLSLNGQERALRFGEAITFRHTRGELRSIEPNGPVIALRFHGQVSGMATGFDATARDIMPTWLEWLRNNQSLSLLWGSALYGLGLFATLLKWWQPSVQAKS